MAAGLGHVALLLTIAPEVQKEEPGSYWGRGQGKDLSRACQATDKASVICCLLCIYCLFSILSQTQIYRPPPGPLCPLNYIYLLSQKPHINADFRLQVSIKG